MLIDFLNEIVRVSYVYNEIYTECKIVKLENQKIEIQLKGFSVPNFETKVSTLCYNTNHILSQQKGRWETQIVIETERR